AHFHILQAMLLRGIARLLGGHLRGKGRALARATETATTRSGPGQRVALPVGDRDDRVVERRVDVRDPVQHVLACLLGFLRGCSSVRGCGLLVGHLARLPLGNLVEPYALPGGAFSLTACLRGPLRVRALVRVRCPRSGRPRRWRMPRYEPRSMRRLMFMDTSRRRSPSTGNFWISERIVLTSASVRSFTLVLGSMPAAVHRLRARERPTP